MKDGIIKGQGNSRLLKAPETIPTTFTEFRTALINGTLPVDVLFNAVGWDVIGTALNKANLLTDAVATALGLASEDPTVNEAINALLAVATPSKNGMMSKTDKTKLDGVANNANNYSHPTGAGNNHIPSGGNVDSILGYSASGLAIWIQQLAVKSLLSTATANLYGLSGTNANADKALENVGKDLPYFKVKRDGYGTAIFQATPFVDQTYEEVSKAPSGSFSVLKTIPISVPAGLKCMKIVAPFAVAMNGNVCYAKFGINGVFITDSTPGFSQYAFSEHTLISTADVSVYAGQAVNLEIYIMGAGTGVRNTAVKIFRETSI